MYAGLSLTLEFCLFIFIYLVLSHEFEATFVWVFKTVFDFKFLENRKLVKENMFVFVLRKLFSKKIRSFKDSFWTTINRRFGVFLKTWKTS